MKCLLSVCLSALAGVAIFAASKPGQTPALQKGISVELATSSHAAPTPDADRENAWIVTVVRDGSIFFKLDKLSPEGLIDEMTKTPRNRDAKLYIKADAGAPFGSVRQVLHAARVDLFDDVVLLTSQPESTQQGTIVAPKGLDVWIGAEAGSNPVTVQLGSEQEPIALKVNNEAAALSELQGRLAQLFDSRTGRIVVLKASGQLAYAQVIHAIDACRAAGASRISMTVSSEI